MISRDQEFQYYIEHKTHGVVAGPYTKKGLRCHITQHDRNRYYGTYYNNPEYSVRGYQLTPFTDEMSIEFVMGKGGGK